ncbi:MAG: peptidylprolyl isomerase [Planctomycetota bacterium]|nr:peptidylprolyl isomerase [Planctomycetota bacterium]
MTSSFPTCLVAVLLTTALQAAQDPSGAPADQAPADSILGKPLIIDGHRITDIEIKRFLCYGKGYNALDSRRLGVLIQQERELRQYETRNSISAVRHAGASFGSLTPEQQAEVDVEMASALAYMEYDEAEYTRRIEDHRSQFTERYPSLDLDTETRRAYESVAWYHDQVRQTLEFEAMFFPGHPDNWPEITLEAIHQGSPNFDLVADYAQHYQWRLEEAEETGEPIKREEEMMMSLLRDYVMRALASLVEIRTQTDGLPPEALMTIEGGGFSETLKTEDVFQEMKHIFSPADVYEAKMFLALEYVAKKKLIEAGALRDREGFLAEIRQMQAELEDSMFNWEFLALDGHQFPSIVAYNEHAYLVESYKTLIAPQLTRTEGNSLPPELQDYLPRANVIMGLGKARADVLLVSAFDFPRYEWKEDGWARAEEASNTIRQEIDDYIDYIIDQVNEKQSALEEGRNYVTPEDLTSFPEFWSDLLDLKSEYWDPPLPVSGKMPPAMGLKNKGRFTGEPTTRNDFRRFVGESPYSEYLHDLSVTDKIFFDMEPGTVGGPYKGTNGYYIVYLKERLAPTNPIDPFSDRHFNMLTDDYARRSFQAYAHQALEEAEVSGLE